MASLLHLKRRISAARNVSKTTRAMQMIAASKLKKAQNAAIAAKPYVEKLSSVVSGLSEKLDETTQHAYLTQRRNTGKTLMIILSPDKGLCGGLITNLVREFLRYKKADEGTQYVVFGKKLEAQVTRVSQDVLATFNFGTTTPTFDMVYPIAKIIDDYYLSGKVDSVKILSTTFKSIFTQKPTVTTILPITVEQSEQQEQSFAKSEVLFEPRLSDMLPELLKHYLEMTVYQKLIESFVAEQASRMMAMQSATTNAKDIITLLQLAYNKTRQAKITNEILDLGSGAAMAE